MTTLTTETPGSRYGIPVLVMDGTEYGPSDVLPGPAVAGMRTGGEYVAFFASVGDYLGSTREGAALYCAQNPEGCQVGA